MTPAPLFNDLALGPDGGQGHWLMTQDGVRIRIGVWGGGAKGTILLFPGRTEYVEKYGDAAREYHDRGFSVVAVDWRGQGLADRLQDRRDPGHVISFSDYQNDVAAVVDAAKTLKLPEPFYLVAHSMGGCIGLRALNQNLPVKAAAFSAPMWGIQFHPPILRYVAWALSTVLHSTRFGENLSPGTAAAPYVSSEPFEGNELTKDAGMFDYLKTHIDGIPDISLGGPSVRWLNEALREMRVLSKLPSPEIPGYCALGTDEKIVDPRRIHDRMQRWTNGSLEIYQEAEHEIMMEVPASRRKFFDDTAALFLSNR